MSLEHRDRLRGVMRVAWDFFRTAKRQQEDRSFGDCLRGAWKLLNGLRELVKSLAGVKHLRFSESLIQSPISRRWRGDPINESYHARLTTAFGR